MIIDQIKNINRYRLPYQDKIMAYLTNHNPVNIPDGEHEIDGRNLFVRVMSYVPKQAVENRFETHRVYADLQFVAAGVELMQVVPNESLSELTAYDPLGDYQFFKADRFLTDLVVRANEFTVFFPGEAHRPSCQYLTHHDQVKKLVFKIRIN